MRLFRSTLFWVVIGLALVGATVGQYRAGFASTTAASQRDTRHDQSPPRNRVVAEGRVATYHGAQITLSSEISGPIQKLAVDEKDAVASGDVIAEIKVEDARAALVEAKAHLAEIDAEIRLADFNLKRNKKLREEANISAQELDKAQRDFELANAQRATAEATVKKFESVVAKAVVCSPIAGVVIVRYAHPGEMAEPGTKLVTIADMNRVRIEAEVDEFDADRIQLEQPVVITAEGYPDKIWQGTVEEIPDMVTEKNLKPLDPSRPSEARVLRVKIAFKEKTPLKLGQRVEIEIRP